MTIKDTLLATLLLLWASPWLLLLVEGVSLFLTGSVLTGIPWDYSRFCVALATPVLLGMVAAGFSG